MATCSKLYEVQRTNIHGRWCTQFVTPQRRRALTVARHVAAIHVPSRQRVMVRVSQNGYHWAGWINGRAAWGLAYSFARDLKPVEQRA